MTPRLPDGDEVSIYLFHLPRPRPEMKPKSTFWINTNWGQGPKSVYRVCILLRSYILWGYMSFLSKKAYQIKIRGMLKSWWTFSCWVCSFWGVWARFSQASKQFSTQNLFTNCLRLKVLQQRNSDASIRQMTPTEKEAWQWRAQRPWRQPVWGQSLAITVWPWANHLTSLGLTFLINEALLIRLSITYWTNYWM